MAQGHAEIIYSVRLQALHGDGYHLGVGFQRDQADQFHARLPELALQLPRYMGVAKDVRRIGEPQGPGMSGQNRACRSCDLRRHVRPQGQQSAAFQIDHPVGLRVENLRTRSGDVKLERGREEFPEPPLLEHAEKALLHLSFTSRFTRQENARATRNGPQGSYLSHEKPNLTRQAS